MIIDAHTHIYPDKIARIVEDITVQHFKTLGLTMAGSFTVSSLLAYMEKHGVSASVALGVAEKPSVVKAANDFIIKTTDNKRIIGMGTMHPDFEDYKAELARLHAAGVKGIKIHSIFQGCVPDEPRMMKLYPELVKNDMIAFFHVGKDPGDVASAAKATPESLANVIKAFPKLRVVAAHMGGQDMLEDSEKYLAGKNLYMDMCWSPGIEVVDPKQVMNIVKKHGSSKMMFGTDYPSCNPPAAQIEYIRKLPLSDADKENIFWRSASKCFRLT